MRPDPRQLSSRCLCRLGRGKETIVYESRITKGESVLGAGVRFSLCGHRPVCACQPIPPTLPVHLPTPHATRPLRLNPRRPGSSAHRGQGCRLAGGREARPRANRRRHRGFDEQPRGREGKTQRGRPHSGIPRLGLRSPLPAPHLQRGSLAQHGPLLRHPSRPLLSSNISRPSGGKCGVRPAFGLLRLGTGRPTYAQRESVDCAGAFSRGFEGAKYWTQQRDTTKNVFNCADLCPLPTTGMKRPLPGKKGKESIRKQEKSLHHVPDKKVAGGCWLVASFF